MTQRIVLVPGVLALLPEYASLDDPVADLRAACLGAVRWLVESEGDVALLADEQGLRVGQHLLALAGGVISTSSISESPATYLVVGNGSARRSEKAPGHLDERAFAFDDSLRRALTAPDSQALTNLDRQLAAELLADIDSIAWLGAEVLTADHTTSVDYDADPFGVQYWVMRWQCES